MSRDNAQISYFSFKRAPYSRFCLHEHFRDCASVSIIEEENETERKKNAKMESEISYMRVCSVECVFSCVSIIFQVVLPELSHR